MLRRPLSRPLAAVLLLSLVDYALWNLSLGANHDIVALVAGLTLIPLLIALAWLLLLGVTRLAGAAARRARENVAARAASDGATARRRPRRVSVRSGAAAASLRGGRRAGARSSARTRRTAPGASDQDAATAGASSSKLAA